MGNTTKSDDKTLETAIANPQPAMESAVIEKPARGVGFQSDDATLKAWQRACKGIEETWPR